MMCPVSQNLKFGKSKTFNFILQCKSPTVTQITGCDLVNMHVTAWTPGEKPSKHRSHQHRNPTDMKHRSRLGLSFRERHKTPTACSTCASQNEIICHIHERRLCNYESSKEKLFQFLYL